jgi:LuxR family maltose regulon positive regulatory protein
VLLQSPSCPPPAVIARTLANELSALEQRLILVLDDYHSLRDVKVHQLVDDLLRHPPRSLHLILAARRDPPLNLAGLRAQNHLTELGSMDLQFTPAEIESFFALALGGAIPAQMTVDIGRRLEGWAVGIAVNGVGGAPPRRSPRSFSRN